MKECLLMFLFFALGYLIISFIDELIDRFVYKVKRISITIPAENFKQLKSYVKKHGDGMKVEKYLQKEIEEFLESEQVIV